MNPNINQLTHVTLSEVEVERSRGAASVYHTNQNKNN